MTLVKCPRCELNYMNEGEKMCSVCRKELRGTSEPYDVIELCSECGENPVVPGQELCAYCLKEFARRNADSSDDVVPDPVAIEIDAIDSVSTMDEIEIDLGDDMGEEPFDDEVFDDEEVPEDEDDEELPDDEDDIVED
ncbi:MAG: hypothetical protein GX647_05710 [Clostridiales bacterium]|jgi:hypothetical protein|nr:hypothetical protein [Clostridiales bacterium]